MALNVKTIKKIQLNKVVSYGSASSIRTDVAYPASFSVSKNVTTSSYQEHTIGSFYRTMYRWTATATGTLDCGSVKLKKTWTGSGDGHAFENGARVEGQRWNPSDTSVSIGSKYDADDGNVYTVSTYNANYYTGTVTVKVALNGKVKSTTTTEYDANSSVTVPIPSAPATNSVLSSVSINGRNQSYKSSGYSLTINDSYTILFNFSSKVKISLVVGEGASKLYGESTSTFTGKKTSATATSSTASFWAQKGAQLTFTAKAATGYVFGANAIIPSNSSYSTIVGGGETTLNDSSQFVVDATTFTARGTQYTITIDIADGRSGWGTAQIKESSASSYGTSAKLKPDETYNISFTSNQPFEPTIAYWTIGASSEWHTGDYRSDATLTGDVAIHLHLSQTKWYLTVANGTNSSWGTVSGEGWYASGTRAALSFTPSASVSNLGIVAYQVNYNGNTASFSSGDSIITTNTSQTATIFLKQTKFKMSVGYGYWETGGWGSISASKEYVGSGDRVTFTFTPTSNLISTIHPQVDHWSILQQSLQPMANADGSSSMTITLGEVWQDFTATAYLDSAYRRVTIQRSDSGDAVWGNFYLDDSGTTTTKYYAPGTTIKIRFVRDTSFDLKERPQVSVISVGTENTIYGVDGTYDYTYTLPTNTKSDLVISCSLKQTAYAITIKTDGNGSLMAQRMDIAGGTVIDSITADNASGKVIYLRYGDETEYLALTATGKEHYGFSAWEKSNLSSYDGDVKKVYLSTRQNASVAATFARSDFCVICATDNDAIASAYLNDNGAVSAYYSKSATQNPVVICKIRSSYTGDYKVASWSVGSQDDIAPQYNAQGDFYYVEVTNWNDVTVTAHIVRTTFKLTVNVGPTNYAEFGSIVATTNGQSKTFSTNGDTTFEFTVRETASVSLQFYQQYGGRVLSIEKSDAIGETATDSALEFAMPSADCSVTFTLGEKEKYQLTVGVQNTSAGEEANIPATLEVKSRTYPKIVLGVTDASGVAKVFTAYKDEEYAIVATAVDGTTSRRYTILGWKDGADYIPNADTGTINVLNETSDSLMRMLVYGLRETGTVTIEYAQKSGDTITTLDQIPDGCLFVLENETDKVSDGVWLIGADIKMPFAVMGVGFDKDGDAYKWTPIEVDIAFGDDEYSTNASWDDGLLMQNGEFVMRGNVKIRVVFTETIVLGYTAFAVGYKNGATNQRGCASVFATEMDAYTEDRNGVRVLVRKAKKVVIMAAPRPGFAFAGWYTIVDGEYVAVPGAKAVYEIAYATSPMPTYYADFVGSTISNVKQWNGDIAQTKTFEWQSRVYVGAQFFKMQSVRAYSDAYPVTLTIFAASSPDDIFGNNARTATVVLADQNPRRLPKIRPEKYFAFKVQGYSRVNLVGIASSMGGLLS